MSNDWVYDTEEFPNVFTLAVEHADALGTVSEFGTVPLGVPGGDHTVPPCKE